MNKITTGINRFFSSLLMNVIPILFLLGLAIIVTAVFLIHFIAGVMATGVGLILIALILAFESGDPE